MLGHAQRWTHKTCRPCSLGPPSLLLSHAQLAPVPVLVLVLVLVPVLAVVRQLAVAPVLVLGLVRVLVQDQSRQQYLQPQLGRKSSGLGAVTFPSLNCWASVARGCMGTPCCVCVCVCVWLCARLLVLKPHVGLSRVQRCVQGQRQAHGQAGCTEAN